MAGGRDGWKELAGAIVVATVALAIFGVFSIWSIWG